MDNLTHSLVGALLGQAGLKRKTALAMPTLIIAANLPDIDAACLFWLDGVQHLGFRRGITHGPIAMLILPVLLWGAMLGWDRWRRSGNADRPVAHRGWLLAFAFLGTLSHPALDWLNTYGVRLLEPFSSRWFYGDSIFIIDLWLWIGFGAALWTSLHAERRGALYATRPALLALLVGSAYILANGIMTGMAEKRVAEALEQAGIKGALVVASPPPLTFWGRDVFWRDASSFGATRVTPFSMVDLGNPPQPHNIGDPRIAELIHGNEQARAFLFWSRMPLAKFADDGTLTLTDQRYTDPRAVGRFQIVVKPDN